jgi:hypothetical protein
VRFEVLTAMIVKVTVFGSDAFWSGGNILAFQSNLLAPSSLKLLEAAGHSETSVCSTRPNGITFHKTAVLLYSRTLLFTEYYSDSQIKQDEMSVERSTHERGPEFKQNFSWRG